MGLAGYVMISRGPSRGGMPTVEVHTIQGATSAGDLSNTTVILSSEIPTMQPGTTVSLAGMDPANNPYFVQLFRGTTNAQGSVSGQLSPAFQTIVTDWKGIITPLTSKVSMKLYAVHTPTANGITYMYNHFDNVPYDPRAPPSVFSLTVSFDLTRPDSQFEMPLVAQDVTIQRYPICPTGYFSQTINATSNTGPLPLAFGNLTDLTSASYLNYAASYVSGTMSLSFTSNTVVSTSSPVVMTENPSWTGSDASFQASQISAVSTPQYPLAMVYIDGAYYYWMNYNTIYQWTVNGTCYSKFVSGPHSDVSITNVNAA